MPLLPKQLDLHLSMPPEADDSRVHEPLQQEPIPLVQVPHLVQEAIELTIEPKDLRLEEAVLDAEAAVLLCGWHCIGAETSKRHGVSEIVAIVVWKHGVIVCMVQVRVHLPVGLPGLQEPCKEL